MGKASRQKLGKKKGNARPYRVRTGAEVRARFGAREAAILAALEAAYLKNGGLSFDARRKRALKEGTIKTNDDGSETLAMSPELVELFKLRYEMFEFKFGRPIGSHDPIFFDEDLDTPDYGPDDTDEMIAEVRAAAQKAGVDGDRAVEHFLGREELADYKRRRH